ncbi:MAG: VCBS repeat-containing protein, partial [Acidobacteria bacterium]|nr:VCBS repeat-containing protein [Acidobacteriota bacterium]
HATVLIGLGDGTLYGPEAYVTSNIAYGMTSGDFNGDGRLDLVGFTQSNSTSSPSTPAGQTTRTSQVVFPSC